jgi:peptidoglycan/xylan/chitin deacetylase (PgdA/CDA1 family)
MRRATITIDIESDWGGRAPVNGPDCQGITEGLPKILDTLSANGCKATFFVSSSLALANKDIVTAIALRGHEICSHGHDHFPDAGRRGERAHLYDLQKSRDILEGICKAEVSGYRSPQFRIPEFLFSNLKKAGFSYDSSFMDAVMPLSRARGKAGKEITAKAAIAEYPVTTLGALNIPFGLLWVNGFYSDDARLKKSLLEKNGHCVFYAHPFDIVKKKRMSAKVPAAAKIWYKYKGDSAQDCFEKTVELLKNNFSPVTLRESV